jgi:outer membrane protein OmpA-like peptidoglycan-associated protein
MKLHGAIAPVLAALLVSACATSRPATAPEARAEQAERDKEQAQADARKARLDAEEARETAADAERARYEADQRARYAAATAAQAEQDARIAETTGVAEPQPVYAGATEAPYPRLTFAVSSTDLGDAERTRLDQIAASLRDHPSRRVVIRTFAEDTGDRGRDERLAQRRADAVANFLVNRGVSGDRIVTKVVTREVAYESVPVTERRGPYRSVELVIK